MSAALAFMIEGENIVFTAALVLMMLIGAVEALGLGGAALDIDHPELDADGSLLGWLGLGALPLLMLLVVFLAAFGVIGLVLQQIAANLQGAPLAPVIAGPVAAVLALPATGVLARGLARVLPRDETSAIDIDELVGRRGVIVTGRATAGSPARARVRDHHGQDHYVMAEPDRAGESFAEGETILIVRRHADTFRAIVDESALLRRLEP